MLFHTFNVFLTDSSCTNNPVFTPPALIVKYGDPANATCVVCEVGCHGNLSGLEHAVGKVTEYITTLFWTVDKLTEWETYVMCYYNTDAGDQCYNSTLSINVYRKYVHVTLAGEFYIYNRNLISVVCENIKSFC